MRRPPSVTKKIADGRLLPEDAPEEISEFVTAHPEGKPPTARADVGIPRAALPKSHGGKPKRDVPEPRHRFVVLGDSLSHGVKHVGAKDTGLSWGAILAAEYGASYVTPNFDVAGGLPFNLEWIARALERSAGPYLDRGGIPKALTAVRNYFADGYDAWVARNVPLPDELLAPNVRIHALAQSGFDLTDAMERTAFTEGFGIRSAKRNKLFPHVPNAGMRMSAHTLAHVCNEFGSPVSLVRGAQVLGRSGGIDTLFVALGANNALGSVRTLRITWSKDDHQDLFRKDDYNVWTPEHFRESYERLLDDVRTIDARRVVLTTIPHVTIVPFAKGIGGKDHRGSRYFRFYVYPWLNEQSFNPEVDPHLTAADARAVDGAIDCYNTYIEERVHDARAAGLDWYVLDMAGHLDRLATKRFIEDPEARPSWWTPADLPPELARLELDTMFYSATNGARTQGGWFGLDGIHPNTVGYTYLAWVAANLLHEAGVTFPNTTTDGTLQFDFDRWIGSDSLISDPVNCVPAVLDRARHVNRVVNVVRHPVRSLTI